MIGEKLGSFRIKEILGTGAMGSVYLAEHEPTGKLAALKIISNDVAQRNNTDKRFEREAEILKQFNHPNIVRWLGVGRFQGTSYFAMEYIKGSTLEQMLATRGALPWQEVVDLGIQISESLHYAHQRGVVHRDLKPSNLMINEKGQVKLADFGIAKDLDATEQLTGTGRTLGTAAYMAPEQIRGNPPVSHKTDLYALGTVLYQMLTGRPPFEGATAVILMHNHLNQEVPRPRERVPEIPKALDDLVVKLMAKQPADRPWDAQAVGHELTKLRDKVLQSKPIKMAWPTTESPAPGAAAGRQATESGKRTRKASRTHGHSELDETRKYRKILETGALVLALLLVAAGIAYVLWPPGQEYLYQHAKALMASKSRSDRVTARDEYIEPLDRRFPGHPYRSETKQWLDSILLEEADNRLGLLDSRIGAALGNSSATKLELTVLAYSRQASKRAEKRDDLGELRVWDELAHQLHPEDKDERGWYLLAEERAQKVREAIQNRIAFVQSELVRAKAKFNAGFFEDDATIKAHLRDEYGPYTSLAGVLGPELKSPSPKTEGKATAEAKDDKTPAASTPNQESDKS